MICEMEKHDPILKKKNDYISSLYGELAGNVTRTKLVWQWLQTKLEGFIFIVALLRFMHLQELGKMLGSAQMVRVSKR